MRRVSYSIHIVGFMTKYSICMTCFNEAGTVRESLRSLLQQLRGDFEVVVVDNFSTDGTYEALREFERSDGVRVLRRRCSRGLGRQIAFQNSSGQYIIANLDLDDVFLPVIENVVAEYHRRVEGKLLATFNSPPLPGGPGGWSQNVTLAPRELLTVIGGWRDLNVYEDWDVWSRARRVDGYRWTSLRFAKNEPVTLETGGGYARFRRRVERYQNRLRLGLGVFSGGESIGFSQRLAYLVAKSTALFQPVLEGQDPEFNSFDPAYYVDLGTPEAPAGRVAS